MDEAKTFQNEMTDAIAATRGSDEPAVWIDSGMMVEIVGADGADWPQPQARISITGTNDIGITKRGGDISSWDELWRVVDDVAAQPTTEEREMDYMRKLQSKYSRLRMDMEYARIERDAMVRYVSRMGVSSYRIAKKLNIAESTVGRILARDTDD